MKSKYASTLNALDQMQQSHAYAVRKHDLAEAGRIIVALEQRVEKLRAALSISRGQWIHSINERQCREALGEPMPTPPPASEEDNDRSGGIRRQKAEYRLYRNRGAGAHVSDRFLIDKAVKE